MTLRMANICPYPKHTLPEKTAMKPNFENYNVVMFLEAILANMQQRIDMSFY
jgi:hypothetical protein